MPRFLVEALVTHEGQHQAATSRWKLEESPDFPVAGDTIYSTGDPQDVQKRWHLEVNGEKVVVVEIHVGDRDFGFMQADPAWHTGALDAMLAAA